MKINQEQIREVEKKFDQLGFFTQLAEGEDVFTIIIHRNIVFNIPKDHLEQSILIQKGDLFQGFLATVFARLLWHNDTVIRLPEDDVLSDSSIKLLKNMNNKKIG